MHNVKTIVDEKRTPIFYCVQEAVTFIRLKNPVRLKIFRLGSEGPPSMRRYNEFHPQHPARLFAATVAAVKQAVRRMPQRRCEIYELYYNAPHEVQMRKGTETIHGYSPDDIAKMLHVSRRTVYRDLEVIREELRVQLERHGLLVKDSEPRCESST